MRPIYIAFEGIEGCGKSTQAGFLTSYLRGLGRETVLARESGGTDIGMQIRQIVVHRPHEVDPWAEALLFAADRAQHIAEVVDPAMSHGRSVVSDRCLYSSIAYQGFGRGLNVDELFRINSIAVHETFPDLVIFLQIDQETMNLRLSGRELSAMAPAWAAREKDRIELAGPEFFKRVIDGYEAMRIWAPCEEWFIIDGSGSVPEVGERIVTAIDKFIAEWWQG
jgi:dTMP kinase